MNPDFDRIREVNDAMQAGDLQTVSESLHPEIVWEHNLGVGSPEEGIYRVVGRGKGSGAPVDEEIAIVWTIRDGKVLRGKVYLDPEEALASVG